MSIFSSGGARGPARKGSGKYGSPNVQATIARHLKRNRVRTLDALPADELVTSELALLRVDRSDKDDAPGAFSAFGTIAGALGVQSAQDDIRWLAVVYPLGEEQTRSEEFPTLLTLTNDGAVYEHREMPLEQPLLEDPRPQIDGSERNVVVQWPDKKEARRYVASGAQGALAAHRFLATARFFAHHAADVRAFGLLQAAMCAHDAQVTQPGSTGYRPKEKCRRSFVELWADSLAEPAGQPEEHWLDEEEHRLTQQLTVWTCLRDLLNAVTKNDVVITK